MDDAVIKQMMRQNVKREFADDDGHHHIYRYALVDLCDFFVHFRADIIYSPPVDIRFNFFFTQSYIEHVISLSLCVCVYIKEQLDVKDNITYIHSVWLITLGVRL